MKRSFSFMSSIIVAVLIFVGSAFADTVISYDTDPAGTPIAKSDNTGKDKDKETGLYSLGARYLKDKNGRFISVDSVGPVDPATSKTNEKMLLNPQKLNRYAYALNNPYRYVDPDGKDVWDIGFFAYSGYNFAKEPSWENAGYLGLDAIGLIPVVPALGTIARVGKGVEHVVDAGRAAKWGRADTLMRHFEKHGADFGAKSANEYASMASDFLVKAQKEKLPTKIAPDGVIRVYEPKTNTFGAYNPNGTTATFFKPSQGQKYWARQPGAAQ